MHHTEGKDRDGPEPTSASVPTGLQTFAVIWTGQLISLLGSGLVSFAIGVWIYQTTGSSTRYAMMAFFGMVPGLLIGPVAGVLVDRWDRRSTMILSDFIAALTSVALLVLVATGQLELWHIYVVVAATSMLASFQQPAFLASIPLLIPRRHLGRAAGLTQVGQALPQIAAPLVAGVLMVAVELRGILIIDLIAAALAITTLLAVRLPSPATADRETSEQDSLLRQARFGWDYIMAQPGLVSLLGIASVINFAMGMLQILITPLVLTFGSTTTLGAVLSVASIGFLAGSVMMSIWGGSEQRIRSILWLMLIQAAILFLGGVRPSALLVGGAAFGFMFCMPLIAGNSQVIWQSRVAPEVLGRVFATRRVIALASQALAYLAAGPLADFVFEPLMATDGALATTVGRVVGSGPGRGIGLLFVFLGCTILAAVALGRRSYSLRQLDYEHRAPESPD